MSHLLSRQTAFLGTAVACSLALTIITITPPMISGDTARLDIQAIYIPQRISYPWPSYAVQVALWLGVVASLWLACQDTKLSVNRKRAFVTRAEPHMASSKRPEFALALAKGNWKLAVLLLTLLGFGLRLYSLNRLPLIMDEIGFAAHASDMLHGQAVPIFARGHNANPATYSWLVAGAMALFGQNAFTIRLIPLVFGTLTIPVAYVLGREWWSNRVGLIAAAFVATFPAHVFYSRMSLYNIADPFFSMLALAFLARAVHPRFPLQRESGRNNHQSRQHFVLVGITAGIAQYFYHGSRLVLVLMMVYSAMSFYLNWPRTAGKNSTQHHLASVFQMIVHSGVLWMLVALVLVTLPSSMPMLVFHLPISGNMEALRLPNDLGDNAMRAVLAWVGQPDVSPFWLSDQPLLPPPALLAFLLGIWFCLRKWRDPRSIVLLLSLVLTTLLGSAVLTAAPLYVRYMVCLPAIVLLVAIGVENMLVTAKNHTKEERNKRRISQTLVYTGVALMLIIVVYGSYVSLIVHPAQAQRHIPPGLWEEDALAREAAKAPSGFPVVLSVSPVFGTKSFYGDIEMMTIVDYVTAFGERRAVIVNWGDERRLAQQIRRLGSSPYALIQVNSS